MAVVDSDREAADEPAPAGGATAATATAVRPRATRRSLDLDRRELAVVAPMVALIIALGFYPQPLLDIIEPAVVATMEDVGAPVTAEDPADTEGTD
jgi:NADH-quinone oxidoreductase subunit M